MKDDTYDNSDTTDEDALFSNIDHSSPDTSDTSDVQDSSTPVISSAKYMVVGVIVSFLLIMVVIFLCKAHHASSSSSSSVTVSETYQSSTKGASVASSAVKTVTLDEVVNTEKLNLASDLITETATVNDITFYAADSEVFICATIVSASGVSFSYYCTQSALEKLSIGCPVTVTYRASSTHTNLLYSVTLTQ